LETGAEGVEWLRAVQKMCVFVKVQAPNTHENVLNLVDFNTNPEVFTISPDVQLILHNMASSPDPIEETLDFVKSANELLRALPEVRCNREAMILLGERVEAVIRALGGSDGAESAVESAGRVPTYGGQMRALCGRLGEVKAYLRPQRRAGWLLLGSTAPPAKVSLDALDAALMGAANNLIMSLGRDNLMLATKEYALAADVGHCVRSLGGLDAINEDTIKERSLAKLIDADSQEVSAELRRGVDYPSTTSTLLEDYSPPPRGCLSCLCYNLCGCFDCCGCCQQEGYQLRKARAVSASVLRGYKRDDLAEPLVT